MGTGLSNRRKNLSMSIEEIFFGLVLPVRVRADKPGFTSMRVIMFWPAKGVGRREPSKLAEWLYGSVI